MKEQVTKKEIMKNRHVVRLPYKEAQDMLCTRMPAFYTCGVYGWYSDIYVVFHEGIPVCLVEGYQPFGHKQLTLDNVKPYNDRAKEVWDRTGMTYEEKAEEVDKILHEFIGNECL